MCHRDNPCPPLLLQFFPGPNCFFDAFFFILMVKDCAKNRLITVPSLPTSLTLLQPVFFYSFFFLRNFFCSFFFLGIFLPAWTHHLFHTAIAAAAFVSGALLSSSRRLRPGNAVSRVVKQRRSPVDNSVGDHSRPQRRRRRPPESCWPHCQAPR